MKIGHIDLEKQVFVIAEIGNNHEGDFEVAQELVRQAARAGVDAVKFQTFVPEHFVSSAEAERLGRLQQFQLTQDQFRQLAKLAADLGVVFFSTPLDLQSAHFLNELQPVFKIASGDNTFFPLIDTVAGFGKPMIVSTGLADVSLLERLRADIQEQWARRDIDPGLAFLHCVCAYPVPPEQANLGAIATLAEHFPDCVIGYSDHTLGIQAAAYAAAAGARIVEKHFTLSKTYSDFRDHQLSADPDDMQQLVMDIRSVSSLLGSGRKTLQPCEAPLASAVRRSVAAARDIPSGSILTRADISWVRPGMGVPPGEEGKVLERKTRRTLRAGEIIQPDDLSP